MDIVREEVGCGVGKPSHLKIFFYPSAKIKILCFFRFFSGLFSALFPEIERKNSGNNPEKAESFLEIRI